MRGRVDVVALAFIVGAVLAVLAVVGAIGFGVKNALHEDVRTCTVTSKERLPQSEGGFDQRVYTEECGVLKVGDAVFAGHYNSADTWASIEEGRTYRLTSRGYRVGFLSMFPNIIEAEEVAR